MNAETKIVLYDPALSSMNLGDHIISESAKRELAELLDPAFVVDVSTHLPVSLLYLRHLRSADLKLVLGSNLLRGRMNGVFRQWDIHLGNAFMVGPAVLVGAGWWQYGDDPNRYTRALYRRVLHQERQHSVRDNYTAERLREAGIENVLVTACPTMWMLTPDHCATIPVRRADEAVTTLTDYNRAPGHDRSLIRTLLQRYERVHFWVQGWNDRAYLESLGIDDPRLDIIAPSLTAYDRLLAARQVDFVGTRLHAGIRALQHGRRALVVAVDNRAREKSRDFGLDVVERGADDELADWIDSPRNTTLTLPWDAIAQWKAQFGL